MNTPSGLDLAQVGAAFDDPVHQAQQCFRGMLDAMAHPGRVIKLPNLPEPPAGLGAAQNAMLMTLVDQETTVWLPPRLRTAAAAHHLRFHCGCPLVDSLADAQFVVLTSLHELPTLAALRCGDPEYPDRSATILCEVAALASGGALRLRGPGIQDEQRLSVSDWHAGCTAFFNDNRRLFPLGVDLLLSWGSHIAALPRTLVVKDGY